MLCFMLHVQISFATCATAWNEKLQVRICAVICVQWLFHSYSFLVAEKYKFRELRCHTCKIRHIFVDKRAQSHFLLFLSDCRMVPKHFASGLRVSRQGLMEFPHVAMFHRPDVTRGLTTRWSLRLFPDACGVHYHCLETHGSPSASAQYSMKIQLWMSESCSCVACSGWNRIIILRPQ